MADRFGSRVLVVLATVASTVTAGLIQDSDWKPAAPTGTTPPDGWAHLQVSHRPTDAPTLATWQDLRRAVDTNTCGFFPDDDAPLSCGRGYTCTNSGSFRDCCVGDECSSSVFATSCVDFDHPACSTVVEGVACCPNDTSKIPFCNTYLWSTTATPNTTYTMFNCEARKFGAPTMLLAEPRAVSATSSSTISSTSSSSSSSSTIPHSSATTPSLSITSSASTAPASTSPVAQPATGGSAPVGPIVGGVVGGLAVIGIVVLGLFYMSFRNRKAGAAGATPEPESSAGQGQRGPGLLSQSQSPMSGSNSPLYSAGGSGSQTVTPMSYVPQRPPHPPSIAPSFGGDDSPVPQGAMLDYRTHVYEKGSPVELVTTPTYTEMPTHYNNPELPG
ncbi:hypothetical protein B0H63DRAFT_565016 [Podospora didyma]|uniref:Mid2 domain-containing protein n=1 Tax=Podospora didyma TaxID=330526 RepID=A0AAE0N2Y4_9PEZI|nr:hypothetical protein B0H63DRAFT_565016 [Podospora didyma]